MAVVTATKHNFINQYKYHLTTLYEWTSDDAKFERFMHSVRATLYDGRNSWNRSGTAYEMALSDLGLKKDISLTKLRALPE